MLYKLSRVKRQFGSRTVLNIPHLELEARKVYALIGANGAGKTTLLNHLAFLDTPTTGNIFFRDENVVYDRSSLTRIRRQVVLVDQTPILFSGTVWSNVEYGLKIRQVPKNERGDRIENALERVGMSAFARSDVHGLSGGEVKRVALARALVLEPDVLLCDEPTANVDQRHQEIILKILQHANRVRYTTIIFSTHYLSQSRRLADRTILLQNGSLSDEMGENSFEATILKKTTTDPVLILNGNCRFQLDGDYETENDHDTIRVHLVPDKIQITTVSGDYRAGCTGTIINISSEGSVVRLTVDMGVNLCVILDNSTYQQKHPLVGQSVKLRFPREAVIISPIRSD